jgi:hypothetical protein
MNRVASSARTQLTRPVEGTTVTKLQPNIIQQQPESTTVVHALLQGAWTS